MQRAVAFVHIGSRVYVIGTEQRFDYVEARERWTYIVSESFLNGSGSFHPPRDLFDSENEALIAAFTFIAQLTA